MCQWHCECEEEEQQIRDSQGTQVPVKNNEIQNPLSSSFIEFSKTKDLFQITEIY